MVKNGSRESMGVGYRSMNIYMIGRQRVEHVIGSTVKGCYIDDGVEMTLSIPRVANTTMERSYGEQIRVRKLPGPVSLSYLSH